MRVLAHIGSGSLEPALLLPLVAISVAYLARFRTLTRRGQFISKLRLASFFSGVLLLVALEATPISHISGELLWVHMVQHILFADFAALLIVLGLSGPMLQPLLRVKAIDRLRALVFPPLALALWVANLYIWHLPVLYQAALGNELVHFLQHSLFLGTGVLIWMPLFGPLPMPSWFGNGAKLIYIASVRVLGAVLANVFIWSETIFYPRYGAGESEWGLTPLADQGVGGSIMMVEGTVLTFCLFAWLFLKAARDSEESQQIVEYAHSRGMELDPKRASRAAAAGRGSELRERIAEWSGS